MRKKEVGVLVCVLLLVMAGSASADYFNTWFTDADPANSRWDNEGNWDNGLPTLLEGQVVVNQSLDTSILIDSDTAAETFGLILGFNPGSAVPDIHMTGGTLDVLCNIYVQHTGGPASFDTFTLEDGAVTCDHLALGIDGTGIVYMTGGTIDIGTGLWVSAEAAGGTTDAVGHFFLDGGTVTAAQLNMVNTKPGSFIDFRGGELALVGDQRDLVDNLAIAGLLKGYGTPGSIERTYGGMIDDFTRVTGVIPEPATLVLLGLGLTLIRRKP